MNPKKSGVTSTTDTRAAEIFCPFPYQVNPRVEQVREDLLDWTRRTGLVHRRSARERFERADFGWFTAVVYPTASGSHLNLTAGWLVWLFLVDDQLDDGSFGRRTEQVKEVVDGMRSVLDSPDMGASIMANPGVPVAITSLADLWLRTAPQATPQWRRRFIRHLQDYLSMTGTWELGNRIKGVVPDEETYIAKRRDTGAIYVCMDLIDIIEQIDVPEHVYDSPQFMAALDASCNVVCWTNDVYSFNKESSRGEVHNLVCVAQHYRGLDQQEALSHVCAAISAETKLFVTEAEELLRTHAAHAEVLDPYLRGMRSWIRGNLDWSRRTKRYHPPANIDEEQPEMYLETALIETGH